MSDDLELLRRYAQGDSEEAFAELVGRHVNLVYSAALRQVRSPQAAEEVAQSTFTDLARNASRLRADTILTAWLYQVARRTAIDLLRRESRRLARERLAAEMAPMNTATDWSHIEPLLDEAMGALEDTDRAAVLLRYFENKPLREVGQALGTTDDAAQKRVSRAVDRLRGFFAKRGVTVGASGIVIALSANAVQAAPAALAASIAAATSLAGTAVATVATTTATKTIAMTTLHKALIAATVAAAVGTAVFQAHQNSSLRAQVQTLQQQQAPLAEQIQQLQQERDGARTELAAAQQAGEQLRRDTAELPRLRGELARLRDQAQTPTQAKDGTQTTDDPFTQLVLAQVARAAELNRQLQQRPDKKIPELQYLNTQDWLKVAQKAELGTEPSIREALNDLRNAAKHSFGTLMERALDKYIEAHQGQLPSEVSELGPLFDPPIDDSILQRYRMLATGKASDLPAGEAGRWVIIEKAPPVDGKYDCHLAVGPKGNVGTWGLHSSNDPESAWSAGAPQTGGN